VEVELHTFLNLVPIGGEWSTSHSNISFTIRERVAGTYWIRDLSRPQSLSGQWQRGESLLLSVMKPWPSILFTVTLWS